MRFNLQFLIEADFTWEPLADVKTHLHHPEHDSGDENETFPSDITR